MPISFWVIVRCGNWNIRRRYCSTTSISRRLYELKMVSNAIEFASKLLLRSWNETLNSPWIWAIAHGNTFNRMENHRKLRFGEQTRVKEPIRVSCGRQSSNESVQKAMPIAIQFAHHVKHKLAMHRHSIIYSMNAKSMCANDNCIPIVSHSCGWIVLLFRIACTMNWWWLGVRASIRRSPFWQLAVI